MPSAEPNPLGLALRYGVLYRAGQYPNPFKHLALLGNPLSLALIENLCGWANILRRPTMGIRLDGLPGEVIHQPINQGPAIAQSFQHNHWWP
jgi:hypothetical protein